MCDELMASSRGRPGGHTLASCCLSRGYHPNFVSHFRVNCPKFRPKFRGDFFPPNFAQISRKIPNFAQISIYFIFIFIFIFFNASRPSYNLLFFSHPSYNLKYYLTVLTLITLLTICRHSQRSCRSQVTASRASQGSPVLPSRHGMHARRELWQRPMVHC